MLCAFELLSLWGLCLDPPAPHKRASPPMCICVLVCVHVCVRACTGEVDTDGGDELAVAAAASGEGVSVASRVCVPSATQVLCLYVCWYACSCTSQIVCCVGAGGQIE